MKVLIVCVNYFSTQDTIDYLESVLACSLSADISLEITIADNTVPEDARLREWVNSQKCVELCHLGENYGFYGGAYRALENYLASAPLPEWVVVSNTDLAIRDVEFFSKLATIDSLGNSIIAPRIVSVASGEDLNPYMPLRLSQARAAFIRTVFRYYPVSIAYQFLHHLKELLRNSRAADNERSQRSIYAAHGSAIVLGKKFFEQGCDINHPCFLYGEEVYIAEQCRRKEITIHYEPALEIYHKEHATTGWLKSRAMARYQARAAEWVYREILENS